MSFGAPVTCSITFNSHLVVSTFEPLQLPNSTGPLLRFTSKDSSFDNPNIRASTLSGKSRLFSIARGTRIPDDDKTGKPFPPLVPVPP